MFPTRLVVRPPACGRRVRRRNLRHPFGVSVRLFVNLYAKLIEREAAGRPVRIGLIGAGKFGTMFLSQVYRTRGMHLVGLADLNVERARSQLKSAGWEDGRHSAGSLGDAFKSGRTHVTADADALIAFPDIDVIVEATGDPK